MELKRHASYWMNWKRWEHLNGRNRDWKDLTSCTLGKQEVKKHHYGWCSG